MILVKFDIIDLLESSKEDYEKTWRDAAGLLEKEGRKFSLDTSKGRAHPIYEFISEARQALISLGFEELVLPIFVDEDEIYKEYGSEAALILDRLFYLAELPRPDIGISSKKIEAIKKILPKFKRIDLLQALFKDYKKGTVEADDFIEEMAARLSIDPSDAALVIDKVFPEFKKLKPIPTKRTLRSHTTALWFPVLGALVGRSPLPLQLFHAGLKFRREQNLDATHLYESNTLSIVVCTKEITLEDCKIIAKQICKKLGFTDAEFDVKSATGKYYAPSMEFEVFVKHEETGEWLEIGDGGFYSPISCAKYDIPYPVFNIGFGIERITMIRTGAVDIRELVYPYFYSSMEFSDDDIANGMKYYNIPETETGNTIANAILRVISEHGDDPAPCEYSVGEFTVDGKAIEISIFEEEDGVNLVSKATYNEIFVDNGQIDCYESSKGTPPETAVLTEIRFVDGVVKDFAWRVESMVHKGKQEIMKQYKMVKKASDVNVIVDPAILRYITDNQKKISIRGPLFVNLRAKIKD